MTMHQTRLLRMAVRLWNNPMMPKSVNRHNQQAWLRSVNLLGDKWLLAKKIERKDVQPENT